MVNCSKGVNVLKEIKLFMDKKDVVVSGKRYGIDALGAMAQGLFCTLLVGTILNTLGSQFGIGFLQQVIVTVGKGEGAVHRGRSCRRNGGPGHRNCYRLCA